MSEDDDDDVHVVNFDRKLFDNKNKPDLDAPPFIKEYGPILDAIIADISRDELLNNIDPLARIEAFAFNNRFTAESVVVKFILKYSAFNKLAKTYLLDEEWTKWRSLVRAKAQTLLPDKRVIEPQAGVIAELNEKYAIIGGKIAKLSKITARLEFVSKEDFSMKYENRFTRDVNEKIITIDKLWRTSAQRNEYENWTFDTANKHDENTYNIWKGFYTKPIKGEGCNMYLDYMYEVLANRNDAFHKYQLGWLADLFQRPWEKPGVIIVYQTEEEGTGKSFHGERIGELIDGPIRERGESCSFLTISNSSDITEGFNNHLATALLILCEEAFFAGSPKEASRIKQLATGQTEFIKTKYASAKGIASNLRLMFVGNASHIVHASRSARRLAVSNCSASHLNDHPYFGSLQTTWNKGMRAALMYYFMDYNLDGFDVRLTPKTRALLDQKKESFKPEEAFWCNCLELGQLPYDHTSNGNFYGGSAPEFHVIKRKLYFKFCRSLNRRGNIRDRGRESSFGIKFKQFFPEGNSIVRDDFSGRIKSMLCEHDYNNIPHHIIPSLTVARQKFDLYMGQEGDWDDREEWIEEPFDSD